MSNQHFVIQSRRLSRSLSLLGIGFFCVLMAVTASCGEASGDKNPADSTTVLEQGNSQAGFSANEGEGNSSTDSASTETSSASNSASSSSSLGSSTNGESQKKEVSSAPDHHNSMISVDWEGTYQGVLPCADCNGIQTSLILEKNGSFTLTKHYLGKSKSPENPIVGKFEWDSDKNRIHLMKKDKQGNPIRLESYFVGENQLFFLDQSGNRIKGALAEKYILKKNT